MELYDGWLIQETVESNAGDIVAAIRDKIRSTSGGLKFVEHEKLVRVAVEHDRANAAMLRQWFFASVGIIDLFDDNKQTFYLSQASGAEFFGDLNVVPWTNWLGGLYVQLKHAIEEGEFPVEAVYGPPDIASSRPVGPLVEYLFAEGLLSGFQFYSPDAVAPEEVFEEAIEKEPIFGLGQIIRTIDIAQNEQIRGPINGAFILIGGPGVGKTTAALHRIPYLINEQIPHDRTGKRPQVAPDSLFFRQTNALVVVWKEHLVPYLRRCITELDLLEFPEENICHIDAWTDRLLREYISFGPKVEQVRLIPNEDEFVSDVKLSFTEDDIRDFFDEEHPHREWLQTELNELFATITQEVASLGLSFPVAPPSVDFSPNATAVSRYCSRLEGAFPDPSEAMKRDRSLLSTSEQEKLQSIKRRVQSTRTRLLRRIGDYEQLLRIFYKSEVVKARLADLYETEELLRFQECLDKQAKHRQISRADTYLLLWIIHFQTEDNEITESPRHRPINKYSHIVVDEAQYYHPVVLRLFGSLAQLPKGVLTIVGDLEQNIRDKGGLLTWDRIGLEIPPKNINRLGINYRSSKKVFEFLQLFREVGGIREALQAPRRWYAGEGYDPFVRTYPDRITEFSGVATAVHEMMQSGKSGLQTVAVVVPDDEQRQATTEIVPALKSFGIHARWAADIDVKESVDHVIVTNRDSIVGLEFDSVFVMGTDKFLPNMDRSGIYSMWVALSRARRFLHVSRVGGDPVFDASCFDQFRPSEEEL